MELHETVAEVAADMMACQDKGVQPKDLAEWIDRLVNVAGELEEGYIKLDTEGDVPTVAQGVALARFLRPHFQGDVSHRAAFVARGGAGLGDNYLHVRFNDGYEGGIDKTGRTST